MSQRSGHWESLLTPSAFPFLAQRPTGTSRFKFSWAFLKLQTKENSRTVSGATSSPTLKNSRSFAGGAAAFSLFWLELRTKLLAVPAGKCIFWLLWGSFEDSLGGRKITFSSPCLGGLQSFMSLCSLLSLLPALGQGFPGDARGKELACQCRRSKRHRFDPWAGKISWRRKWQPTPVFLPGKTHRERSLAGYSPKGRKESDTTEAI